MIENYDRVDVFVSVDVGKGEHHAVALNKAEKIVFDKALQIAVAQAEGVLVGYLPGLAMLCGWEAVWLSSSQLSASNERRSLS